MLRHLVEQVNGVLADDEKIRSCLGDESILYCMLDKVQEAIEESGRVEKSNRSLMNSDLCPCSSTHGKRANVSDMTDL